MSVMTSDLLSSSSVDSCPVSPSLSSSLSSELLSDVSFLLFFCCFPLCLCFFCFFFWRKKMTKKLKESNCQEIETSDFLFSTFFSFLCLCCFLFLCFFSLLLFLGFSSSLGTQTEVAPPLPEQDNNRQSLVCL